MFGVLSQSQGTSKPGDAPIVLMLNAGSAHHIGPNRLYVSLARELATQGVDSFRMDLRNLGDSGAVGERNENNPYPDTATEDVELTLKFLQETFGYRRFVLLGLCSGAYTAFVSALNVSGFDIVDSVLINPLTYRWEEGMSLESPLARQSQESAHYRKVLFRRESWIKLLKGNVDIRFPARVVLWQCKRILSSAFVRNADPRLAAHLNGIFDNRRSISLFVAEYDPGFIILRSGARATVKLGLKSGKIRLQTIENADHTFTAVSARRDVIARLVRHIARF